MSHNSCESPLPKPLFFISFCVKVGLSSACWSQMYLSRSMGTMRWFDRITYLLNRLFLDTMRRKPVGSVTELSLLLSSSNCWSNKSPASLSVSLLEHPLEEKERETEGRRERHVQPSEMLARKRHFSKVDNTQTYIVSLRINQLHTLLICPKHTLFNPHTLGLISQARSNTLIVRRVKSFHYNAGDADPVCGESTTPTPQSLPRHYSLSSFPSCLNLSSDAPISCNSYVSSHSRWVRDDTMGSLIIFCSHHHHHFFLILAVCVSFEGVLLWWTPWQTMLTERTLDAEYSAV